MAMPAASGLKGGFRLMKKGGFRLAPGPRHGHLRHAASEREERQLPTTGGEGGFRRTKNQWLGFTGYTYQRLLGSRERTQRAEKEATN
jgi:hypothetical protein